MKKAVAWWVWASILGCAGVARAEAPAEQSVERDVSKKTLRKLESHLAKRSWKKASAVLDQTAKQREKAWCDLSFETRGASHHARLFMDVAFMARKVKRLDEAWACLHTIADTSSAVYEGGAWDFPVLGLTKEAAYLYEAARVFPRVIAETGLDVLEARHGVVTARGDGAGGEPRPYDDCQDESSNENTQRFVSCVVGAALALKKSEGFDAAKLKDALLWRSVRLVPRSSVVKKLSKGARAEFAKKWEKSAPLSARRSVGYASYDEARAAIHRKMNPGGAPPCKRAGSGDEDDAHQECVSFSVSKSKRYDEEGAWWRAWTATARDDIDSVYGDSCYENVLHIARASAGSGVVHALELDRLHNNEICGSGGWGDWRDAGVVSHDADARVITLRHMSGAVFKSGGSSLVTDEEEMASWVHHARFVCQADGEGPGFACLFDSRAWEAGEGDEDTSTKLHIRAGHAPPITFVDGKATWKRSHNQFIFPEYDVLRGKTFAQVVEMLPEVNAKIRVSLGVK